MTISPSTNPLLQIQGLPAFSEVRPEHLKPAIEQAIAHCKQVIERICANVQESVTWDSVMAPIEEAEDSFSKIWSVAGHLNSVCNTPQYRQAFDDCLPLVSEYSAWAGQYRPLYDLQQQLFQSDGYGLLTKAQRKAIENSLRDFKLAGVDLDSEKRAQYIEITSRLTQLESDFSNHVLDATHDFFMQLTDPEDLNGLPSGVKILAQNEAQRRGLDGYVFTLDMPSYLPFLTYADKRSLRERMYRAYNTRASELSSEGRYDNGPLMEEILKLRHDLAQLLGFESYAHYSLATKMAKTPAQVLEFLTTLAQKSRPQGLEEMEALRAFAREHGQESLEPWDIAYWSEKLREAQYAYNAEQLRPYFPINTVLKGMFECARRLYKISFRPRLGVDVWHEDVRCYDVHDEYGSKIGTIFMDLYAREGKRGGAWMDECYTRRYRADGSLQLPVTYLVCNFSRPVGKTQSQLTHDEVTTLFHEFGHSLNHLLTRIDIAAVSGINGVCWDAVELPSQFHENFAWYKESLNFISGHIKTHEPLPEDKLNALLAARNFEAAMAMLRQLEFALFDFRIHLEYDPARGARIEQIHAEVKAAIAVVPQFDQARFANAFTHVFAGGYAAGYYSYKWAEVLAADAFGRFIEQGLFNAQAGADFERYILAIGGAEDPLDCFISFRGRRPEVEALLEQSGIRYK